MLCSNAAILRKEEKHENVDISIQYQKSDLLFLKLNLRDQSNLVQSVMAASSKRSLISIHMFIWHYEFHGALVFACLTEHICLSVV